MLGADTKNAFEYHLSRFGVRLISWSVLRVP